VELKSGTGCHLFSTSALPQQITPLIASITLRAMFINVRWIRRGSFVSAKDLVAKIETFVDAYNAKSTPFVWTATSDAILG
jgi:hypothetical protein